MTRDVDAEWDEKMGEALRLEAGGPRQADVTGQFRAADVTTVLRSGGILAVGAKLYMICRWCEQVVCLNKRFLGARHVCLSDQQRAAKARARGLSA